MNATEVQIRNYSPSVLMKKKDKAKWKKKKRLFGFCSVPAEESWELTIQNTEALLEYYKWAPSSDGLTKKE